MPFAIAGSQQHRDSDPDDEGKRHRVGDDA